MAIFDRFYETMWSGGLLTPMLMIDVALFALLVFAAWNVARPAYKTYKMVQNLDGAAGPTERHWFFGHAKQFPGNQEGLLKRSKRYETHPTMFHHWLGPYVTSLVLHHSDTAISLLSSGAPKSELLYGFIRPWIGDGLLTSHGKKWQRNRHLLTPAFHFNILKGYAKVANECSKTMLDKWDKAVGLPIDISEDVSLMTLDTMLKCAMSSNTNCQLRNGHPYIKAVKGIGDIINKRAATPYLFPDFIFWRTSFGKQFKQELSVVHSQAEQIIAERRVVLEQETVVKTDVHLEDQEFFSGSKKMLDFLDILIQTKDEDGNGLTDREIRDEVDTFLFEGHDTTSSGVAWALYNLAKYPLLQEKCRNEVKETLGDKQVIEWKDLPLFNYLTMFIKESMRLYPPVFSIGRSLKEPMILRSKLNKHHETVVPEGATSSLHIFSLHRNELLWENAQEFDPERFTKENIAKRPPHAYLPFSAGSRNCIGQNFAMNEMKIVLAQTLQRYRLYLDEETPEPIIQPRIILQSKNGIFLKLERL